MFLSEIKNAGDSFDSPLEFSPKKTPVKRKGAKKTGSPPKKRPGRQKKAVESEDEKENVEDDEDIPLSNSLTAKKQESEDDEDIIEPSFIENPKSTSRGTKRVNKKDKDEEEPIVRSPKNISQVDSDDEVNDGKTKGNKKPTKEESEDQNDEEDPYEGYTDAMKEIMLKKLQNGTKTKRKRREVQNTEDNTDGYTETMKEMVLKKKERLASKRQVKGKQAATSASKASDDVAGVSRSRRARPPHSYKEDSDYE